MSSIPLGIIRKAQVSEGIEVNSFKDTHREKAPSDKTLTLTESTNMGIWVVGTTNQFFIRGS